MTESDDLRRVSYGATGPTPEQYAEMMNAVFRGAFSREIRQIALARADSAAPTVSVESWGSTPPETKSLGPVAAAPKADDDQAIDPSIMTALMEAIDQIEARVSACEAARNV